MSEPGNAYLVVMCDVDPEVEDDFNRWYDDVHLPEILACPGFIEGVRAVAPDATQSPRYVAMYTLEDEAVLDLPELQAVRGWGPWEGHIPRAQRLVFHVRTRRSASAAPSERRQADGS